MDRDQGGEEEVTLGDAAERGTADVRVRAVLEVVDQVQQDGKAYFAKEDRSLADKYAKHYGEGVIEIQIPTAEYNRLFQQYEEKYEGGPLIEVPIPNTEFGELNKFPRFWHR